MKKREESGKGEEGLSLKYYRDKGYFSEFADNHFLMQVLNENAKLPDSFQKEIFQFIRRDSDGVQFDNYSFGISLAARLCTMFQLFDEKDVKKFLRDQFSAGKNEYNQESFFQALSEIECISYVANMVPDSMQIECEYEPHNNGRSNPEARIKSCHQYVRFVYDIEVKTADFKNKMTSISPGQRYIKLNIPLINGYYEHIQGMADECDYKVIRPNYLKIKDYIQSAHRKFLEPTNENQINILFINWTFVLPRESCIMEPCALLYDDKYGILKTEVLHEQCKIEKEWLSKISAIVVYCDSYDSIVGVNLLTAVQEGLCKIMFNDRFCKNVNREKILRELRISEAAASDCKLFELWANFSNGSIKEWEDASVMKRVTDLVAKYM